MTGIHNTPKVLHIVERDNNGNETTIRYYREDTLVNFVDDVKLMLLKIENEADRMERKQNDTLD